MAWRSTPRAEGRTGPVRVEAGQAATDYLAPYRDMVGRVGASFESLLWSSRQTQAARFGAVTAMIDLSHRIVLDAGCGLGDFAAHLERSGVGYRRYIGVDALEPHIAAAKARGVARAEFHCADFVADPAAFSPSGARPDVVVFSGSLNTLEQAEAERVLEAAWRSCAWALVFNFLCRGSGARVRRAGPIRRFDPTEMVGWALRRTAQVAYRQEYLRGEDGTVVMWVG